MLIHWKLSVFNYLYFMKLLSLFICTTKEISMGFRGLVKVPRQKVAGQSYLAASRSTPSTVELLTLIGSYFLDIKQNFSDDFT